MTEGFDARALNRGSIQTDPREPHDIETEPDGTQTVTNTNGPSWGLGSPAGGRGAQSDWPCGPTQARMPLPQLETGP